MSGQRDQTFRAYGARLITDSAPYDPFSGQGDPSDDARYTARPGIDFLRPWLAIRGGLAFQWPLGMQGFSSTGEPTLGIHKFVGDSGVAVDVIHRGEKHVTLSGNFPGDTSPDLIQGLEQICELDAPPEGKILFVPEIMSHAQFVAVVRWETSRAGDDRGRDVEYTIEMVRTGIDVSGPGQTNRIQPVASPTPAGPDTSKHLIYSDSSHNSLRKIAAWKLGSASRWRDVFDLNQRYFLKHSIPLSQAPDYRLPVGTPIYY